MGHDQGNAVLCVPTSFESRALITIDNGDGRPAWAAAQIGNALGYAEPDALVKAVRTDWREEFEEGVDFRKATRHELMALKAAGAIAKNTPSLLLLTESGVNLAAILSRQPAATRLRRWLAREVLPQLRATGSYRAEAPPAPVVDRRSVEVELLTGFVVEGLMSVDQVVPRLTDSEIHGLPWARLGQVFERAFKATAGKTSTRSRLISSSVLTAAREPRLDDETQADDATVRDCAVVILRRWFPGRTAVARA
jgi:prophage antirepressor-like protein